MDDSFLEYYKQYKDLLDNCIPKEVLGRLLGKAKIEAERRDAWEPESEGEEPCPF